MSRFALAVSALAMATQACALTPKAGPAAAVVMERQPAVAVSTPTPTAPAFATSYLVDVDASGFTDAQVESVLGAVSDWESAVNAGAAPGDMTLRLSTQMGPCADATAGVICVRGTTSPPPPDPITGNECVGETAPLAASYASVTIYTAVLATVNASVGFPTSSQADPIDGLFRNIVAHELGHAMGLGHEPGAVLMNAVAEDGAATVTTADAAQWRKVRTN